MPFENGQQTDTQVADFTFTDAVLTAVAPEPETMPVVPLPVSPDTPYQSPSSNEAFYATSPSAEDYSGPSACTTTTTSCAAGSLTNGTQYYFTVEAFSAGGASVPSSEVSATPDGPACLSRVAS